MNVNLSNDRIVEASMYIYIYTKERLGKCDIVEDKNFYDIEIYVAKKMWTEAS